MTEGSLKPNYKQQHYHKMAAPSPAIIVLKIVESSWLLSTRELNSSCLPIIPLQCPPLMGKKRATSSTAHHCSQDKINRNLILLVKIHHMLTHQNNCKKH